MSRRIKQEPVDDPVPAAHTASSSVHRGASDDDEVIGEIPIRLVKPSQRLLYLLQNPLRPSNRPYEDAGPLISVHHKHDSKLDMLQMKYRVAGEAMQHDPNLQESLVLTSSTVRPQGQLLVGRMIDGELVVRPFTAVLRMRPDFSRVDEERRQRDALNGIVDDSASLADDSDKPAARAVTVKFQREESEKSAAMRQRSHAFQQAQQAATPWTPLKVVNRGRHAQEEDDGDDDDLDSDVDMGGSSSSSSSSSSSTSSSSSSSSSGLRLSKETRREVRQLVTSLRRSLASPPDFDPEDELGGCEILKAPEYLRRVTGGDRSDDLDALHPPEYQNLLGTAPTSASATQVSQKPPATYTSPSGQKFSMPVFEAMSPERRSLVLDDVPRLRAAHDVIRGRILGALVGSQVLSTHQLYTRVGALGKAQKDLTLRLVEGLGHLVQGNWVCPSDFVLADRPRMYAAREWLLLQFSRSHRIPAAQPQLAGRLADWEFSEITERLCKPVLIDGVPHLELAQPMDVVFADAERPLVMRKSLEFDLIEKRLTGEGGLWSTFQMSEDEMYRTPPPVDLRFSNSALARSIPSIWTGAAVAHSSSAAQASASSSSSSVAPASSAGVAGPALPASASVLGMGGAGDLGLAGLGMLAPPRPGAAAGGAGAKPKFAPRSARGAPAKRGGGQ